MLLVTKYAYSNNWNWRTIDLHIDLPVHSNVNRASWITLVFLEDEANVMNHSRMRPVHRSAPNHQEQATLLLYELVEISIKLVATSATLLEQVVHISTKQAEVSNLFAVEAHSLAMERRMTEGLCRTPSDEAEFQFVLRLAYAAAQSSAKSAESMRALVGNVSIPVSGKIQFADDQVFTLLDIHSNLQQIEQCFENVSLCSPLSPEHIQTMRLGVTEMVATTRQNAHAAIRAAEAADYIHLHAVSLIQTLERSVSPSR